MYRRGVKRRQTILGYIISCIPSLENLAKPSLITQREVGPLLFYLSLPLYRWRWIYLSIESMHSVS